MDNVERVKALGTTGRLYLARRLRDRSTDTVRLVTYLSGAQGFAVSRGNGPEDMYRFDSERDVACLATWRLYDDRAEASKAGRAARAAMGSQERYTLDHGAH